MGNCLAIREIIPKEFVEQYARINDLWKAEQYMMSDAELEMKRRAMMVYDENPIAGVVKMHLDAK